MVKGPDLTLCGAGACVNDGAHQHQEILEVVHSEDVKGKFEVQTISLQGLLMDLVLG